MGYYFRFTSEKTEKMKYYEHEKNRFYGQNRFTNGFVNITEEKRKEIFDKALLYTPIFEQNEDRICQVYTYLSRFSFSGKLDLQLGDEILLFFLYIIDPELKLLQIYYEEDDIEVVKKRFQEEFLFPYESKLLDLEKSYNKRFPTIEEIHQRKK